ncbi:MAG: TRAP transporter large permease subunit, partial [Firmicutes bacterium]|nr:TRAP transporter large permease subunit [Bacillota bacterium]
PVHLGIIIVVNLTIGLSTPPFGLNLFVASSMIDAPVMELGKKSLPYILSYTLALLVITFIPWLSLVLL